MTGSASSHLSDDSLLLLISGELPEHDQSGATSHLRNCDNCRRRLDETQAMLADLKEICGKADLHRFSAKLSSLERSHGRWFSWRRPLAAAVPAAAILIGVLIWNGSVRTVTATELVSRAVREEAPYPRRLARCRLLDAGVACAWSAQNLHMVSADVSCERVRQRLESANWDWTNPLSARSFERWRSSLADKQDTVSEQAGSVSLRTSTSRGVLRAATLQVRSNDFHPIAAYLELEESAKVEISEVSTPEVEASASVELLPAPTPVPTLVEPPDSAAVQARIRLHDLDADLGYETVVRRGPQTVTVVGLVRDSGRRSELTAALAGIPGLDVHIKTYVEFEAGDDSFFPKGEQGNTLPPLAAKWLKLNIPNLEESAAFVNRTVQTASALLGEAAVLEDLAGPAAKSLRTVQRDHQDRMASLLAALAADLEPLTGRLTGLPSVGLEQARILQSAVTRCFSASRPDAGSLEAEVARIHSVFNGR